MKHKKLFAILTLVCFMFTLMPVTAFASDGVETVTTQEALRDALKDGGKIILGNSISVTGSALTIAAGTEVTLDLNGKVLSGVSSEAATSAVIDNNGTLIIMDSTDADADGTGGGKITSQAQNPDTDWSDVGFPTYANNTIRNMGHLTVKSGIIENTTEGGACYPIDNNSGNRDAVVVIDGGKITSDYNIAIRQFANSTTYKNDVTVNDGEIIGKRAIWMQLPTSNSNNTPDANITVTGGTLTGRETTDGYKLAIYVYSYGDSFENVDINIGGNDTVINGDVALGGGTKTGSASLEITDGTFNGFDGDVYSYNASDEIKIKAGTFTDLSVV